MHHVQEPELLHHEEPAQAPRAGRMEKVLPAVQQADGAQGVKVIATAALEPPGQGCLRRARDSVPLQVRAEVRKLTSPNWHGLQKAAGGLAVFVISRGVLAALTA